MKSRLPIVLLSISIILLTVSINPAKGDIVLRDAGGHNLNVASGPYIKFPANETYDSGLVTLYANFHGIIAGNVNYSMSYSLDGGENQTVALVEHYFGFFPQTGHPEKNYMDGSVQLPLLSNGSHSITVYVKGIFLTDTQFGPYSYTSFDSQTVHFTICSPVALLMEDTYNRAEIPLNFIVNETASQIIYSLDSHKNETIMGNGTLSGLSEGTHTIIVYCNDTSGNFNNFDTATFSITKPLSDNLTPTPAVFVLLVCMLSIAVPITILLFLKKRRKVRLAS